MDAKMICPMCNGKMTIKTVECDQCHTSMSGKFDFPSSAQLSPEIMNFIKVFIYAEGNIKKAESILNCSYPKIKNLLKHSKIALGLSDQTSNLDESQADEKQLILDQLDAGEISFDTAMELIKKLR